MRRVFLSNREVDKLTDLQKYSSNSVERRRSLILLLSHQGHSMLKVAKMAGCCHVTVWNLLNSWDNAVPADRFSVLRQAKGQGAKSKLQPVEAEIPKLMEKHDRNLKAVLQELEEEHGIKICKLTLHTFLKDTGLLLQACKKVTQKQTE